MRGDLKVSGQVLFLQPGAARLLLFDTHPLILVEYLYPLLMKYYLRVFL